MEKIIFHNFTEHPIQIIAEELGSTIDLPPEKSPFVITKIKKIREVVPIQTNDDKDVHIAIERNRVSLKSEEGFPGPRDNVRYLVPQILVEAIRKTNRSTTRDLIVPEQDLCIGPYRLHYANIVTELDLEDPDTSIAMHKTWRNSVNNLHEYKYHESYESDR